MPLERFSHIHLDVVGPLAPEKGYSYLLTCVDRYARWPMMDQTAETIATTVLNGWIARYGVPQTVTSDRGTNFGSNLFHEFAKLFEIEPLHITPNLTAWWKECIGS